MSKPSCKDKRAYFTAEEAAALALPGNAIYNCPHCGCYHATSVDARARNRKRFNEYRKHRRDRCRA